MRTATPRADSSATKKTSTRSTTAAPDQLSTAAPTDIRPNSVLPFDLPSRSAHAKLVFAHYFPPYPISLDNRPPSDDYYTRNYLSPRGESGKFAAVGGLLRDRPIPRDPLPGDWKLTDMETDVRNAVSEGVDGFAVDILSASGSNWGRVSLLLTAAEHVDTSFKIMLQPDMTASLGSLSPSALADLLAPLASHSSAYRLADGRLVVAPFKGEAKSVDWWKQFLSAMKSQHGITVAFMPVLLDVSAMDAFAPISYGFGEWGMRDPASVMSRANLAARAHALGKKWMAPVAVQDVRPNQHLYNEAGNTETLRDSWVRAIKDDADLVLLTTWNDYSESTSFAPSIDHGWTFLDISAYYESAFQTGSYPSVRGDALYVTHRIQGYQLQPTDQSAVMSLWPGSGRTAPRNKVEVLSFLVAPAAVTVHIGGARHTYQAPAGVSAKLFDLEPGTVSASASRDGSAVADVTSPYEVKSHVKVQDLQYYGVSSRRPAPRQP